ncbi:MAG: hypothetical protein K9K38_05610 [Rhodoferax sp.]|nr:hypothetical protein [Rhodoferax sp.]
MLSCILNQSENYIETFSITAIEKMPDAYSVLIESQLLDAKDPSALHVKYQAVVSGAALIGLKDALNAAVI